ncbi:MAG: hypothetical protein ABI665_19710 [Vicinamibacterales bacterium]
MWSPKTNANGARNPFYDFMREVAPGDIVFSFCDTRIKALGIVSGNAQTVPKPDATEHHYVWMGRLVTALLMLCAAGMTFLLESTRSSFELLLSIGAGSGLLYLLRWYWWRINAWSEIAAMAVSFIVAVGLFFAGKAGHGFSGNVVLLVTVGVTTVAWVGTTMMTSPESEATLIGFYRLVRPAGSGWGPIPAKAGVGASPDSISTQLLGWVLGCTFVYATLFGAGSGLYGLMTQAIVWGVVWLFGGAGLICLLNTMWRADVR